MKKSERTYITDMDTIRAIQLGALDVLTAYCKEHGLTYYLTGGTLLGAVRHKGFIPWDDDIDVVMPRPDYERLLSESGGLIADHYRVLSFDQNANHGRLYYRFVDDRTGYQDKYFEHKYESCMGIDVFPIDGVPENEKEQNDYFNEMRSLRRGFIYSISARFKGTNFCKALLKTFIMIPYKIRGSHYYYEKIVSLVKKYPYETSDTVALTIGYYNRKEIMKKEQYGQPAMLMFEGKEYAAPADYKGYLTNLFGEYMQLPPENERVAHHSYLVWYR